MGVLAAGGTAAGLAMGRLPGAVVVAVSLFVGVVAMGLGVARIVAALEGSRIFFRRVLSRARSRTRCSTCGRTRAHIEGIYLCRSCDGVRPTSGGLAEDARPR